KSVWLSVHAFVAKEFEQRAMICIAARLREDVHLSALVPEFRRVNADLNFKLLNRINRGKRDICIEVWVSIIDAVERVVVEHDALPARGNGLAGAIAALAGARLPCRRREYVHVGRKRDQVQVLAAVER